MCGITGAISLNSTPLLVDRLKGMVDIIAHRGPDDAGYLVWQTGKTHQRGISYGQPFTDSEYRNVSPLLPVIDSDAGEQMLREDKWDLFFGHRRLSIIDLTARGHQPMADKAKSAWLAYNGEIYNFREIRKELEQSGHGFESNSDTEVIIHAYLEWGIDCVKRFNGMFAFALWDAAKKKVHLVRDRFGIKPLYYYIKDGLLLFGSEIKSITHYLNSKTEVDLLALNEYFSFQNTFSGRTLFSDIKLLEPGRVMTINQSSGSIEQKQYWDFDFTQESVRSEDDLCEGHVHQHQDECDDGDHHADGEVLLECHVVLPGLRVVEEPATSLS